MKSKSGREVIGYVVREGKVRGAGLYMGVGAGADWGERGKACTGILGEHGVYANWAEQYGGRVVTLVRKRKGEVRVTHGVEAPTGPIMGGTATLVHWLPCVPAHPHEPGAFEWRGEWWRALP